MNAIVLSSYNLMYVYNTEHSAFIYHIRLLHSILTLACFQWYALNLR